MKEMTNFKAYCIGLGLGSAITACIGLIIGIDYGNKRYREGVNRGAETVADVLLPWRKKNQPKQKKDPKNGNVLQFKSKES